MNVRFECCNSKRADKNSNVSDLLAPSARFLMASSAVDCVCLMIFVLVVRHRFYDLHRPLQLFPIQSSGRSRTHEDHPAQRAHFLSSDAVRSVGATG